MDHTPFIIAAYSIGFVVLLWCAVAPLMRKKSIARDIRRLIQIEERSRDPNS
ncbi:MAG: heme exporter protein CcmD [Xanthomonadales bacterium]|nr:heme exporter protein CcmD [Gammaproteobacteria bacterium]MBT8053725.1 heme exporter protein CcmD [Gammaproteobacteria bacterium]NND56738.1 heme exporter protein CcmD [Xanthomonadales bacterium]NNK50966.1 heme exporter protein CcmD [Xanthomonadales bacterium]